MLGSEVVRSVGVAAWRPQLIYTLLKESGIRQGFRPVPAGGRRRDKNGA